MQTVRFTSYSDNSFLAAAHKHLVLSQMMIIKQNDDDDEIIPDQTPQPCCKAEE